MKFNKLVIANIENKITVFVGLIDNGENWKVHWQGGLSYCFHKKADVKIVKEFPYDPNGDEIQIWEFEKQWIIENAPKPQKPCARLGFIAPNGDFYPCAYACHHDLAEILGTVFYDNCYTQFDLEKKGWISLCGGAIISFRDDNSFTQDRKSNQVTTAQLGTLEKIIEAFENEENANPDINWEDVLTNNSEGYDMEYWCTSPTERIDSYAREMRNSYDLWFDSETWTQKFVSKLSKRPGHHTGD